MNTKQLLRYAFFGALIYGAYKLGEKNAKDPEETKVPDIEPSESDEKSEADYIREIIDCLQMKPNKTRKDKDNIDLLQVKLKQLLTK